MRKREKKKLVIIIPEECSIPALYEAVAEADGRNPIDVQRYDCKKLNVSDDIYDAYKKYMVDNGHEDSIGALWLCMGPKINHDLKGCEVEVQEGFIE